MTLHDAWGHQAISWPSVDESTVRLCGIHVRKIFQEMIMISIRDMSFRLNISVALMKRLSYISALFLTKY